MPTFGFIDERLPTDIEALVDGGYGFENSIQAGAGGFEDRNIEWAQARWEGDLRPVLMRWKKNPAALRTDVETLQAFHFNMFGSANTFRWRDPIFNAIGDVADAESDFQSIGTGDDVEKEFPVFRRWDLASHFYDQLDLALVVGQVVVLLDGTITASGFTITHVPGKIVVSTEPAGAEDVGIACLYDLVVRFKNKRQRFIAQPAKLASQPPIGLIQTRIRST